MSDKTDKDDVVFTEEDKATVRARLERTWAAKWDQPTDTPGVEGATPQGLARAFRRVRKTK